MGQLHREVSGKVNRLSDQVAREGDRDHEAVAGMMGPAASVSKPSSELVGSTTAAGSHQGAVGQPVASFAAATGPAREQHHQQGEGGV